MVGEAQDFVQHCLDAYQISGNVLEVGSLDVNGTPKWHFRESNQWTKATAEELLKRFPDYTGVDILPGNNVDFICSSHDIYRWFAGKQISVIVCAEMLEHDAKPWQTAKEFLSTLLSGGHLILTTCGFTTPHHHPPDYFRFSVEGLRSLFEWAGFEVLETKEDEGSRMICARKP